MIKDEGIFNATWLGVALGGLIGLVRAYLIGFGYIPPLGGATLPANIFLGCIGVFIGWIILGVLTGFGTSLATCTLYNILNPFKSHLINLISIIFPNSIEHCAVMQELLNDS